VENGVNDLVTSELGWVRTHADPRLWIPCPGAFPADVDCDYWATGMAEAWLERSGSEHKAARRPQLAAMLKLIHERGYARVPCHQIWVYLRDEATAPLPVHVGIWKMTGRPEDRLPLLAGAHDDNVIRPSAVAEIMTENLGAGIRVLRHKRLPDDTVAGLLGFAFRSTDLETDVQVFMSTPDLRQLHRAMADIENFVHNMAVYPNPAEVRKAPTDGVSRQAL
jgi:hypothetical protein